MTRTDDWMDGMIWAPETSRREAGRASCVCPSEWTRGQPLVKRQAVGLGARPPGWFVEHGFGTAGNHQRIGPWSRFGPRWRITVTRNRKGAAIVPLALAQASASLARRAL